jgi:hypothetical protein
MLESLRGLRTVAAATALSAIARVHDPDLKLRAKRAPPRSFAADLGSDLEASGLG